MDARPSHMLELSRCRLNLIAHQMVVCAFDPLAALVHRIAQAGRILDGEITILNLVIKRNFRRPNFGVPFVVLAL